VDALQSKLNLSWVRVSTPVSALAKVENGWTVEAAGVKENYDSVIVCSPAWAAGVLLSPVDEVLGDDLSAIPYSSSITVNLLYDEATLGKLPDGFGFLVPASEGRRCWPAPLCIASFWGVHRRERLCCARFWAA